MFGDWGIVRVGIGVLVYVFYWFNYSIIVWFLMCCVLFKLFKKKI